MESKQLVIICTIILLSAIIISTGIYFGLTQTNNTNTINTTVNNTTNATNNTNITAPTLTNNTDTQQSSNGGDDYVYSAQRGGYVRASGQYDSDGRGNTIHSYVGSDNVIYEEYYDSNGNPISSEDYYR